LRFNNQCFAIILRTKKCIKEYLGMYMYKHLITKLPSAQSKPNCTFKLCVLFDLVCFSYWSHHWHTWFLLISWSSALDWSYYLHSSPVSRSIMGIMNLPGVVMPGEINSQNLKKLPWSYQANKYTKKKRNQSAQRNPRCRPCFWSSSLLWIKSSNINPEKK